MIVSVSVSSATNHRLHTLCPAHFLTLPSLLGPTGCLVESPVNRLQSPLLKIWKTPLSFPTPMRPWTMWPQYQSPLMLVPWTVRPTALCLEADCWGQGQGHWAASRWVTQQDIGFNLSDRNIKRIIIVVAAALNCQYVGVTVKGSVQCRAVVFFSWGLRMTFVFPNDQTESPFDYNPTATTVCFSTLCLKVECCCL